MLWWLSEIFSLQQLKLEEIIDRQLWAFDEVGGFSLFDFVVFNYSKCYSTGKLEQSLKFQQTNNKEVEA